MAPKGILAELEFDALRYEARHNALPLKLERIPMELLALLVEKSGQLVSRQEIVARIWGEDVFVQADQGINTAVRKIRRALHDDPDQPQYLETIVGKGYRFIGPVKTSAQPDASPIRVSGPMSFPVATRRYSAVLLGAAILVAVVAIVLTLKARSPDQSANAHQSSAIRSVAVMPLENLSGDSTQDYFVDGISDELLTRLAKVSSLRVISRSSAMRLKTAHKPIAEIAKTLNVDALVEGSVVRAGDRVRVTAKLADPATGRDLWAESYERDVRDTLALQADVAMAIARAINLTLTMPERTRLSTVRPMSPDAYEAFLKGRYHWNKRTPAGIAKSIEYYQRSLTIEPGNAIVYASLATSYSQSQSAPRERFPRAREAALKALELDDSLAEGYEALASIKQWYEWDFRGAEQLYERAVALSPGYATAHQRLGLLLANTGRVDAAIAQALRARELDPLSLSITAAVGWYCYFARQYDRSISESRKALDLDPDFGQAHEYLGYAYQQKHMYDAAITEFQAAKRASPAAPTAAGNLGHAYGIANRRQEALKILDELRAARSSRYVPADADALIYLGINERAKALDYLERAVDERAMYVTRLRIDPIFDSLRSEPRFVEILRRIGLSSR